MLRGVLEQLGHHVLHARDGRRAYELAQICEVDLIMLARPHAGDGRGGDHPRHPHAGGPTSRMPIVAVIDGDGEEARAVLEAGADQVLRKPVSVSSAARVLAAVGARHADHDRDPGRGLTRGSLLVARIRQRPQHLG